MTESKEPVTLHVYTTSCDWWVAESEEAAALMHKEHYGETLEEMCDDLTLLPGDKIIRIVCDENGEISDHGESVERTAAEWAAREGRGLLASSEY